MNILSFIEWQILGSLVVAHLLGDFVFITKGPVAIPDDIAVAPVTICCKEQIHFSPIVLTLLVDWPDSTPRYRCTHSRYAPRFDTHGRTRCGYARTRAASDSEELQSGCARAYLRRTLCIQTGLKYLVAARG